MGIHGMKRLQAQKHQSMHRNLNSHKNQMIT